MKAKIVNPGCYGETLELEGTPEELAAFLKARKTEPLAAPLVPKGNLPVSVPWFQVLDGCPLGGAHEYPVVWMSVSPPPCLKCGQVSAAPPQWTVTWAEAPFQLNPMPPCHTTIVQDGNSYRLADQQGHRGCTD